MSKALMNDVLLQSVGKSIIDKEGETIGTVIEVTRSVKNHFIEYLIMKTEDHKNGCSHFFAIPASTRFITISDTFAILSQLPKEDIFSAKMVQADQCPAPNLEYGKSIFELSNYHSPEERTTPCLNR